MVTFGTVQTTGDNGGGDDSDDSSSGSSSQSSTTPSTTFAPLGTAGLVYLGDILSGASVEASQEFMVTGGVTSGIYNLPITLQYTLPDGTAKQSSLSISMVVMVPPRLLVTTPSPLPETVTTGETIALALELLNRGRSDLNLTEALVSAQNAEIMDDSTEIRLEKLKVDDDTILNAIFTPQEEGPVEVTVTINYLNDLNQPGSIVHSYNLEAVAPPPPPDEPVDMPPLPVEPEPEINWLGQAMMALLGLGS
jgi:hypothetical protein